MKQSTTSRPKTLEPRIFEFQDDSHLHVGHTGNRGSDRYSILVISTLFQDTPRPERQRTIENSLQSLSSDGLIHALNVKTLTPEEYSN